METLDAARRRGATILGEICGYGAATDSHHLTQPHPEGNAALASMNAACTAAQVKPEQIGYVNAHGTGTPLNDSAEAAAINRWAGARAATLPDVPTVAESILPGYELTAWFGIFAPAGTPQPIVDKLAADIDRVLRMPALVKQFESLGTDASYMAPPEFAAFVGNEYTRWTRAFKESGVAPK
jgi:3-oxoacyl-(acyl-carrier-protein) synthase